MTIRNFASIAKISANPVAPSINKRSARAGILKKIVHDKYTIYVPKEKAKVRDNLIDLYKSIDNIFGDRIIRVQGPLSDGDSFNADTRFDLIMNRYKKAIVEGSFAEEKDLKKARLEKLRLLLDPTLFHLVSEINDVTVSGIGAYEELFKLGAENIYSDFHKHFEDNYQKHRQKPYLRGLMKINELADVIKQTQVMLQNKLDEVGVKPSSNVLGALAELYVNQNSPAVTDCLAIKAILPKVDEETDYLVLFAKENITYEHLCVFYANNHYPTSLEELKEYTTLPIDWLEAILSGKE